MRRLLGKLVLGLVTLLAGGGLAFGQIQSTKENAPAQAATTKEPAKEGAPPAKPDKPKSTELEKLLAEALTHNPDVRVGEAKLREAEAELNRVRLQVLQKLSMLHLSLEAQRAAVKNAEATLQLVQRNLKKHETTPESVQQVEALLAQEKGKMAALEAELPLLLGRPPQSASPGKGTAAAGITAPTDGMPYWMFSDRIDPYSSWLRHENLFDATVNTNPAQFRVVYPASTTWFVDLNSLAAAQPAQGAMADKIRKALDTTVTIDIEEKPFSGVVRFLEERVGVSFHTVVPTRLVEETKVSLHLKQVPLGAAFQALEDTLPELRFAVREYGILVTSRSLLPPGATLLHDFWKGRGGKEKAKESAPAAGGDNSAEKNPPAEDIEGLIKATDPQSGMVTLSLGSDAGLRKGHTLEVYRLKPEPKYLGTIRIVEVRPTEAIGKPTTDRSRGTIEAGDRVTSSVRVKTQ